MCLEIVSRNMWNATPVKPTTKTNAIHPPVKHVFLTYTNTHECKKMYACKGIVKTLQDKAIRLRNIEDIFYSFMIGGDGKVYEGRGFTVAPSLPGRYQYLAYRSLYIAYIGAFDKKRPSDLMRKTRYLLLQYGIAMDIIDPKYEKIDIIIRERVDVANVAKGYRASDRFNL